MKDPFEDAAGFFYEVEPDNEGHVDIETMAGDTYEYDKIDMVVVDHVPFIFGMKATKENEYVPVDTFPVENVQRIGNTDEEIEFL